MANPGRKTMWVSEEHANIIASMAKSRSETMQESIDVLLGFAVKHYEDLTREEEANKEMVRFADKLAEAAVSIGDTDLSFEFRHNRRGPVTVYVRDWGWFKTVFPDAETADCGPITYEYGFRGGVEFRCPSVKEVGDEE